MIPIILVGIGLCSYLFFNYYPPFGGKATKEKINKFEQSSNFSEKRQFVNLIPTTMGINRENEWIFSTLKEFIKGNPNRRPKKGIPIEHVNKPLQLDQNSKPKLIWFGHSTFYLELDGKSLLIDPMFGYTPSPIPLVGMGRFNKELPIDIDDLPPIDIVVISHDHYDHLDHSSIKRLKGKVNQFIVPLGVGSHLVRWGINPAIIQELDWWDQAIYGDLQFVCTPSRHFSGRSLTDRNATLWSSWVIKGNQTNVFFCGDSGYGPHFKEIGEKFGPFDFTLMECGQYDRRWASIHMLPEETVQAHIDLKGMMMIPIHWGAFTLSFHDWTDPIERVSNSAQKQNVIISTPKIGEIIHLDSKDYPNTTWWREL